ncbi:RNA polymerase sigma factor SigJ [Kribbella sp. NPDC049584]|uniref:RNA polymerase sigma factor SigJ n=1 Tax=Kribbella sp. NPDC049584 TaxID=3154833 RepID=UPI003418D0B1
MTPSPVSDDSADVTADAAVRRRLHAIAYRMTGSQHDAEDVVQEGLARWHQLTEDERALVRQPLAWLTRVVSRLCLDQLRSARAQREHYRGIWLPEPQLGDSVFAPADPADPADRVTLDDSVSYAFLVALEKLTPAERVSFILHDVFGVPFAEIAGTVGRSSAACRQLAVTARAHLAAEPRFDVAGAERDRVVAVFLDACRGGDLRDLVAVLDPNVVSVADGGEQIRVARRPVVGAEAVATYLLGVLAAQGRQVTLSLEQINGRAGIAVHDSTGLLGAVDLVVIGGRVARIAIQVNPEKLNAQVDD